MTGKMSAHLNPEFLIPNSIKNADVISSGQKEPHETNGMLTAAQRSIKTGVFWTSLRFRIGLLLMNSTIAMCFLRGNISMAMVCMVNSTAARLADGANVSSAYGPEIVSKLKDPSSGADCSALDELRHEYDGEFEWTSGQQGAIFSSLWIGSFVATVPSGVMADRFSAKLLISLVYTVGGLLSFVSPVVAEYGGYIALSTVRFVTGLAVGFVLSCLTVIITHWVPPNERSTILAISTSGNQLGLMLAFPLFAKLCSLRHIAQGWPLIFYFCGCFCAVSLLLWMVFMTSKPAKHRLISSAELEHIQFSLESQSLTTNKNQKPPIPVFSMLRSKAVWACISANFSAGFHVHLIGTYLPTYFKDVLSFNLKNNGWFSSLPYLVMLFSKNAWSYTADFLKTRRTEDAEIICKTSQFASSLLTAIFIMICSLLDCTHSGWAVALLCLSTGALGGQTPGFMTSLMSICPQFSGTLRSLTSVFSMAAGILCPYMVGYIVVDRTRQEWQVVFGIDSALMLVTGVIFLFCGTTKIQPWAMQNLIGHSHSQLAGAVDESNADEMEMRPVLSREAINTL